MTEDQANTKALCRELDKFQQVNPYSNFTGVIVDGVELKGVTKIEVKMPPVSGKDNPWRN